MVGPALGLQPSRVPFTCSGGSHYQRKVPGSPTPRPGRGCTSTGLSITATAEYLVQGGPGEPLDATDWAPTFSQRARASPSTRRRNRSAPERRVLRRVVDSGEAWLSGTTFGGRRAFRLSVSNWQTSDADIARALEAFRNAAACR